MSSSSDYAYLNYISKQIYLYGSFFFYISAVISCTLCSIMFISLKQLHDNPSSIYLLVSSLCNLILFNTSFLSRLLLPNFITDPSSTILVWCKLRQYFGHTTSIISLFCTAWAMIDQYLSTSSNVRLRQYSNMKIARYIVLFTILIAICHSSPIIIYNEITISKSTNLSSCVLSGNAIYRNYITYFVTPFLIGIIPSLIMIIFAILAYANVNNLRQVRMRTQIQQQLTRMVSAQVILVLIGTVAYTTQTVYNLVTASMSKSTRRLAQENVAFAIIGLLSYTSYSFNLYMYLAVSPSFRRQFKRLIKKYLNYIRCIRPNQITVSQHVSSASH